MNNGQRRSLKVMRGLKLDLRPRKKFLADVLCRKRPIQGLGGRWQRDTIPTCGLDEHEARRNLMRIYLADGYFVKSLKLRPA